MRCLAKFLFVGQKIKQYSKYAYQNLIEYVIEKKEFQVFELFCLLIVQHIGIIYLTYRYLLHWILSKGYLSMFLHQYQHPKIYMQSNTFIYDIHISKSDRLLNRPSKVKHMKWLYIATSTLLESLLPCRLLAKQLDHLNN